MRATTKTVLSGSVILFALTIPLVVLAGTLVDECATMQSGWVFCSGFEEGSKAIWDDYDGNPDETNLIMLDPGPFNLTGNHVMRLRVPPDRGGADLVKVLPGSYDRLYARWFIKYEPGYLFTPANHGSGLHAGDRSNLGRSGVRPNGADWFSSWIQHDQFYGYTYYRGMYQDCVNPNGSCWGDSFPCVYDAGQSICTKPQHRGAALAPMADRWYCVEMMMDGGTPVTSGSLADGKLAIWLDGQLVGSYNDLWLRTTPNLKLTILWLNLFFGGDHSAQGAMFDNVVVSMNPIGCGRDRVPPTAPKNLGVK